MKVTCPKCRTSYGVAADRVPLTGARVSCPNCGGTILVPGAAGGGTSGHPGGDPAADPGKDFGKTISMDFSQIVQGEDEAAVLAAEALRAPAFLRPGVAYALREDQTGELHRLSSADFVLGRSGADLVIQDPEISRRHCRIRVMGDHLVVIDLGSTNGLLVRGEKVKAARLTPGQSFTVGNTHLTFSASPQG